MNADDDRKLLRIAPYFPVTDVPKAVAYYEDILGFQTDYADGSPAEFAVVSRDKLSIMFRRVPNPHAISPNEQQGGTWDAFFWVRDAEALHDELRAHGATIIYAPTNQSYGVREFAVRDGDGYVLGFGQVVGSL